KSLYAFGDVADGIKNTAIGTFLLFYLTPVCGLSGSLAGAAIAITLTVDAIADPLIGYISDNTRSRWGRRHPYLFGGALPLRSRSECCSRCRSSSRYGPSSL